MREILVSQLRCGIPGCEWSMPVSEPTAFDQRTLQRLYACFRQHCAGRHNLNPGTNELPGLDHASFIVDASRGACVEIIMDAVIDELEFENCFDLE